MLFLLGGGGTRGLEKLNGIGGIVLADIVFPEGDGKLEKQHESTNSKSGRRHQREQVLFLREGMRMKTRRPLPPWQAQQQLPSRHQSHEAGVLGGHLQRNGIHPILSR